MKILNLTLKHSSTKRYLNIADAIRTSIKKGNVAPLEKLPSARSLAEQLKVNRHTIMAAYNELIAQGWVETKQRRGYTVAKTLPIYESMISKSHLSNPLKPHQWRVIKADDTQSKQPASRYRYNFAGGNPDINLFPFNEFRTYLNDALNRPNISELNYGDNAGFPAFIKEVSIYLRRVRSINNKEIIVVNGTQEALYILAQVLLTEGDKVAVESLGYQPAWNAFKNTGATLIGIKQTSQGIDVEHLESMFKQHKIRLLYLTPLHQYPTTTTLPAAERIKVYRLAQHYQIPIIEDDYDHEFHYDSQPLAPMAANDPSGLIIYLSSFSKLMFPGIRLGIIAVDKTLSAHLINYRTIINHKANVVLQDAIARWMNDGAFERQLRKATRVYQKRRQCMIEVLTEFKKEGLAVEFFVPPGGMALWVDVGSNAEKISMQAKAMGIFLLAENSFHLEKDNNKDKFIRLGFSGQDEENIRQGLLKLKPLLNKNNSSVP
ncbi:PLP-dependent aminotransferase family protein [Colwelliaceae bacterium 6441]